jgi:hypothetical protein
MSKKTSTVIGPQAELTAEQEKAIEEQLKALQPIYHNAPEDLEAARVRIMELELVLGDLHRAAEIATVVRDFSVVESFLKPAEAALENKITVEYPGTGPMKITVVEGKVTDETKKKIRKKHAEA